MEIPSIPPGFESLAPFTLKKVENHEVITYTGTIGASELRPVKLETEMDYIDNSKNTKNHTHRARRKYNQIDNSGDESEIEQVGHKVSERVTRTCQHCTNFQKVTANWCPEEARRPDLEEAPVFYPSEEEFEDTLKYIDSIRSQAEPYGICRIVPPPSWKPPCPLKEKNIWEKAKFATRIQRIDKLQNRDSLRKILQINNNKRKKKHRCMKAGDSNERTEIMVDEKLHEADFGFEPGPDFTLDGFEKYANDFKSQYFKNNCASCSRSIRTIVEESSVENIEGEFWRIVEKPTEEIEVLYGADVETGTFGSGFPKNPQQAGSTSDMKYVNSGWNLNNFPRLPGSVLSFESSDITGVLVPWLYIGMCFSSFCWHVEDHYLYSFNYLHWGAPKIWYGVPGTYALKLEAAMRKHLPDLFEEQPDLLHKLVTQLSPSILRREGVPVHRCVQKSGEFVMTFPRAYHAGFNCGFNCAEAVNVAPIDWLPYGHDAIELYQQQGRKTSISHDKLLLGAAREAVKANWECNLLRKYTSNNLKWKDVCGEDGILSKALKTRVEMERTRREFLCKSSQSLKMDCSFDANSERECSICLFDLHLSAAGCHFCSPNKYACLNHAKQLCSCSLGAKFFLFRYDINELTLLVEAVEGKLSAVYRWARLDLGLALSSYVSKESKQIPKELTPKEPAQKEMSSPPTLNSSKDQENGNVVTSTEYMESVNSPEKLNPLVVVLALENVKASTKFSPQKVKSPNHCFPCKKGEPPSRCKTPSLENNLASVKLEKNHSVFLGKRDVIFLSDDEGNEPVTDKYTERTQKNIYPDSMVNLDICATNTECVEIEDNMEFKKCLNNDIQRKKETPDCDQENSNAGIKPQEIVDNTQTNVNIHIKLEPGVDSKSMDSVQTVSCSASGLHNNLDRFYRQKGPRIAKVVRRISCNVEPLEYGVVRAGKLWCDSRAIYPKGFKSRVKYIDVVDPSKAYCFYVSEILDAGRDGPLFMVSVEHSPSEVFIHASASRCWEMVRERVNNEISKQHKLGRRNLPPLQPPGSVDGIEMFGFSSPVIMQVIQANDKNRVCSEYWKSRPLMQIPQQYSKSIDSSKSNSNVKSETLNDHETGKIQHGIEKILTGLFEKANSEELHTLYSLLSNKSSIDEKNLLIRLLKEEIHK